MKEVPTRQTPAKTGTGHKRKHLLLGQSPFSPLVLDFTPPAWSFETSPVVSWVDMKVERQQLDSD